LSAAPSNRPADAGRSPGDDRAGLAWIDLSTGKFEAAVVPAARLADELARIQPAECLVAESAAETSGAAQRAAGVSRPVSGAPSHPPSAAAPGDRPADAGRSPASGVPVPL